MKDFDYRYTNDTIQIIKAAGLFVPEKEQNYLALIVKIMEIKLVLEKIKAFQLRPYCNSNCKKQKPDIDALFHDLKDNLHKENADKLDSFYQIYKAYEMYQQAKDLMDVLGPDALSSFMNFDGSSSIDFTSFFEKSENTDSG